MPKATLDLEDPEILRQLGAEWRFGAGWEPGSPNEGLVAQSAGSSARQPDYDDSDWEVIDDVEAGGKDKAAGGDSPGIRKTRSTGLTFGWYRISVTLPETVGNFNTEGTEVWFESNIDDYGEIWVDGEWDRDAGAVNGFNVTNRVRVTESAKPGDIHVIACLAANGPLARPGGGIFMRYALLEFEK